MALLTLAGLTGAIGVGLCLWALYGYLRWLVDAPTAGLLIGLLALVIAGGFAWAARRLTR